MYKKSLTKVHKLRINGTKKAPAKTGAFRVERMRIELTTS